MSNSPEFDKQDDRFIPPEIDARLGGRPRFDADGGQSTLNPVPDMSRQPGIADAGSDAKPTKSVNQNSIEEDQPDESSDDESSIFRNRNFMLLWIAQALSQTAQNTLNLALVNYVYQISDGSPTQTALETVAFVLPGVFFSALAGAFVDRIDKRTILVTTNVLRAVVVPWLFFMTNISAALAIPLIFLITCLFSTFSQFFAPAEGAVIPFLVSGKNLTKANSLFQVTLFGSQFIGFSILAPLLPRWIGSPNLFLVISVIYFICIGLTWLLPNHLEKDRSQPAGGTRSMITNLWSEIKDGWQFIRKRQIVWLAIIYLSTVQSVLFTMIAIGIPFVSKKNGGLGQPESDIIYVLAPISIGLGIGVWLVNKLVTTRNRDRIMVLATVAMGINLIAVGMVKPIADLWVGIFTPGVPLGGLGITLSLVALSIPFGFEIGLLNIPALTLLQEKSPKEVVGRVFAAYFTFANFVSIFPILFSGALSDLIGLTPTFAIIGLCVVGVGYYGHITRNRDNQSSVEVGEAS